MKKVTSRPTMRLTLTQNLPVGRSSVRPAIMLLVFGLIGVTYGRVFGLISINRATDKRIRPL